MHHKAAIKARQYDGVPMRCIATSRECVSPILQALLKLDGKLVVVGVPPNPLQLPTGALIFGASLASRFCTCD